MITFLFKRKPIHIDCFTANVSAYKYSPIQPANYFLPEWWKKLPKTFFVPDKNPPLHQQTMRRCAGFIDIYSKGLMLPLWSDLSIQMTSNGMYSWRYADGESSCTIHRPEQLGSLLEEAKVEHMKITSPWIFSCNEDVQWYFTQPIWNHDAASNFCIPSGVLSFKYQGTTNINMLIRKQDTMFTINQGTPMAHMVPLSDRPIKIKNHLLTGEEYFRKDRFSRPLHFENSYYKRIKILKEKESKCPFGFKKS